MGAVPGRLPSLCVALEHVCILAGALAGLCGGRQRAVEVVHNVLDILQAD